MEDNANTESQRKPVSQAFRQDVEKLLSLGWKKDAWGAWINPENGAHFTLDEAIKHRSNTESQEELWIEYNRLFLDQIKQGYSRVHAEQIARHDFILSRKSTRPDERDEIIEELCVMAKGSLDVDFIYIEYEYQIKMLIERARKLKEL